MSRQSSSAIALRPARRTFFRRALEAEALEDRLVPAALNAYEVKAVEIINQLRANPAAFAEDLRQLYLGGSYQSPTGYAASDPIWTDLRARINSAQNTTSWRSGFTSTGANTFVSIASALPARAPIVWDTALQDGAIAHDQWMYTNVYAHSVFTQGAAPSIAESQSNPIPGITRNFNVSVGDWFNYTGLNAAGENISYAWNMSGATHQAYRNGQITATGYYQRLVYADVLAFVMEYSSGGSWGHLQNLAGNYNVIGISTLLYENPVETYQDGISQSYFSTHRLGLRPNANYANVIIYQDTNSNNAYDAGEGLTGQVNFNFGQTTLTVPSTGYSTVQLPTSGTYTFSASYQGVSLGSQQITANAANKTVAFKVTQLATTVNLTATPQATTGGSLVTFTATVPQSGATGTIQFKNGGINLGAPVALNLVGGVRTAVLQISSLTEGSHSITAAYSGDSLYAASVSSAVIETITPVPAVTSVVVNGGPAVTLAGSGTILNLAGQRSVVKQILVTFNQAVTVAAGAFTLTPRTQNVTANGAAPSSAPATTTFTTISASEYLIRFVDDGASASNGGILKSGIYDLTTLAAKVTVNGSPMTANRVDTVFALFGTIDSNNTYTTGTLGNGASKAFVDPGSLFAFSDAFGANAGSPAYTIRFDANLDGAIDPGDLFAFSDSFGADWAF